MRIHSCNAFVLVIVLLLVTSPRLPAPISEIATPTPTVAPKPKSKQDNAERTKPKQSPFAPFAGVWTGSVTGGFNSDIGLNVSATNATTIRIGADGSFYNSQGSQNVPRPLISADGHTLTWTYQYSDSNGTGHGTASLRLIGPKTATYQAEIIVKTPSGNGVLKSLGTLTKQ
jgi:hypothetical protein